MNKMQAFARDVKTRSTTSEGKDWGSTAGGPPGGLTGSLSRWRSRNREWGTVS